MRNAKASPLNTYAVKNGCNRDGNEKARKGLGCTNRSVRMDRLGGAPIKRGRDSIDYSPTQNKIARQAPVFEFEQDGHTPSYDVWIDPAGCECLAPIFGGHCYCGNDYVVLSNGHCIATGTASDADDWQEDRRWEEFDAIEHNRALADADWSGSSVAQFHHWHDQRYRGTSERVWLDRLAA